MKIAIKIGLAVFLVLAVISCTKENNTVRSSTVTQPTNKALTFTIGQHYGGGIIFYIDSTGQHGLIADTVDLPRSEWSNGALITTGATAMGIGKGHSNTKKIILAQGKTGDYAALICSKYKGSGYKDWFLPSHNELKELYNQKNVVGGFADEYYYTSTELNNKEAWKLNFTTGHWLSGVKFLANPIRAVRAF